MGRLETRPSLAHDSTFGVWEEDPPGVTLGRRHGLAAARSAPRGEAPAEPSFDSNKWAPPAAAATSSGSDRWGLLPATQLDGPTYGSWNS